jgi:Uma2 family endonuclease
MESRPSELRRLTGNTAGDRVPDARQQHPDCNPRPGLQMATHRHLLHRSKRADVMLLMEVPHPRHSSEEDDLRALEELFWALDFGPRHRVELLDGRIEVSPKPAHWHERVVMWLIRRLDPVCEANGWDPTPGADVPLQPGGDIIEPDYIIARDPAAIADERSVVPHDQALLVAEICSPSSIRQDREVEPAKCAQAGIS